MASAAELNKRYFTCHRHLSLQSFDVLSCGNIFILQISGHVLKLETAKRSKRNDRNETTEKSETTETIKTKRAKRNERNDHNETTVTTKANHYREKSGL